MKCPMCSQSSVETQKEKNGAVQATCSNCGHQWTTKKVKARFDVYGIVVVGMMSALVFVFTYLNIKIPTPLGPSMLHFGNVMCLLSALLFGRLRGGLAAGIGSMFYDFMDPIYIAESWVTFILKFTMAFVAGSIAHAGREEEKPGSHRIRMVVGAVCGGLTYVLLYVCKTFVKDYMVLGYEIEVVLATMVTKGLTSLTNNIVAVAASLLLNAAIRPALNRAGISKRLGVR